MPTENSILAGIELSNKRAIACIFWTRIFYSSGTQEWESSISEGD